jgi:hypothetical protein
MKFECGDLDRALEHGQLMPEAREHLKHCPSCRKEYRLWNDISAAARELHEQWDSPNLWPAIENALRQQPQPRSPRPWWADRKNWAIAAAFAVCAAALVVFVLRAGHQQPTEPKTEAQETASAPAAKPAPNKTPADHDFLTEQALAEVERTESAYRLSIDRLSNLAAPELRNPHNAVAVNATEKLKLLDSAINETRANLARNRYNVHLQTALADLYREKKQTLEELLTRDQTN